MAKTSVHYGITVLHLIEAGILTAEDEVTFEPRRGEVYEGKIGPKGELVFGDKEFSSPSGVARSLAGNDRNGWQDMKVRGRPLLEYRDQLGGPRPQVRQPPPPHAPPSPSQLPAQPSASPISLTNLIAEHMRGLTNDLAHRIASLSAEQFEELVKVVLEQLGYSDVRRVGGPGDRNIDVIAVHRAPFIKVPIRVQVKHRRGAPNVGPTDVAAFRDRAGGADHVLLMVTNAEFTDGAKETASEAGRQVVHLVDGKDLIKRMIDEGIGLRQGVMGILHVDEDFWREMEK